MKPSLRDLIPVLIIFLFVACLVALILELLIPAVAGRSADDAIVTALSGILTAMGAALAGLYLRDTANPPPPPPADPSISHLMEQAREEIKRFLDEMRRWRPRLT